MNQYYATIANDIITTKGFPSTLRVFVSVNESQPYVLLIVDSIISYTNLLNGVRICDDEVIIRCKAMIVNINAGCYGRLLLPNNNKHFIRDDYIDTFDNVDNHICVIARNDSNTLPKRGVAIGFELWTKICIPRLKYFTYHSLSKKKYKMDWITFKPLTRNACKPKQTSIDEIGYLISASKNCLIRKGIEHGYVETDLKLVSKPRKISNVRIVSCARAGDKLSGFAVCPNHVLSLNSSRIRVHVKNLNTDKEVSISKGDIICQIICELGCGISSENQCNVEDELNVVEANKQIHA